MMYGRPNFRDPRIAKRGTQSGPLRSGTHGTRNAIGSRVGPQLAFVSHVYNGAESCRIGYETAMNRLTLG